MRFTTRLTAKQFWSLTVLLAVMMLVFIVAVIQDSKGNTQELSTAEITSQVTIHTEEETQKVTERELIGDPVNYEYPWNTMSADWGSEVYEEGFRYYETPYYHFPEVAQVYLWCICKDAGVDYYIALALIERESSFNYLCEGDNGNSKGLMQIYERWHTDRMERLGVTDLYNPYQNMRVGVDTLKEIQDKYLASSGMNCVLMVYNAGETGAKRLWSEGKYSSEYSRAIVQRAPELKQELQDQ